MFDMPAVSAPTPVASSSSLAIFHYSRDNVGLNNPQEDPMYAQHSSTCGAPTNPPSLAGMHLINTWQQTTFTCNHHIMTTGLDGGFGAITLQPPVEADWSTGPVTITVQVSLLQMNRRDWIGFFLTPFSEQLQEPAFSFDAGLNGEPKDALRIALGGQDGPAMCAFPVVNFQEVDSDQFSNGCNWSQSVPKSKLIPGKPNTVKMVISSTHVTVSDPVDGITWMDKNINLPFTKGVFQMVTYNYDQLKACPSGTTAPTTNWSCAPDTWHWHGVSISRAHPITIIPARETMWDATHNVMNFPKSAPSNSFLEFYAYGTRVQVSFDGGATWKAASKQLAGNAGASGGDDYWMAVPESTTKVLVRGQDWDGSNSFFVRDATILSETASGFSANTGTTTPGTSVSATNQPTPAAQSTPRPASPQPIQNVPCAIVVNGKLQIGTCSGTFQQGG
jgi:hypothetical protein